MDYQLKRLTLTGVAAALEKAERYRDLNQPEEAESICRDIIDVSPEHQGAWRTLGLALTDMFPSGWTSRFDEAIEAFTRLADEYERVYYTGVAWERAAKAQIERAQAHNALASFEHALAHYERAESLGGGTRGDPVLRWNRCVRVLNAHPAIIAARREPRDAVAFGD